MAYNWTGGATRATSGSSSGGAYGRTAGRISGGTPYSYKWASGKAGQDRQHEINMREMQYMAAQQALGIGQGQGGGAGGMNSWLQKWDESLQQSQGVYNTALQSFEGTYDWMMDAKESANRLGGLADTMEGEYASYREEFAGTEEAFRLQAQEELEARGVATQELMSQMEADYEGVAGQAMADVTSQGQIARQAEARRMQRLGVDPSTMQGQASSQRIAGQEATGKAMAATQARRGEKQRVAGVTGMAMQYLDPSKMAQTAIGIRGAGTNMLGMASQLRGQHTSALSGLAGQQANIAQGQANVASSMAQNIAGQYGEMGGLQMGLQYDAMQNAQNMFSNYNWGQATQ